MNAQIVEQPDEMRLVAAAAMLRLMADPTRLHILWALLHGEHSVNELADHVGAAPASVSQHLAKLRLSQIVQTRREGNFIFYRVQDGHVERLITEALWHAEHVSVGAQAHHKGRSKQSGTKREKTA